MHYPSGLRRIISGCNEDMKDQWCVREGQFSENYGKKIWIVSDFFGNILKTRDKNIVIP